MYEVIEEESGMLIHPKLIARDEGVVITLASVKDRSIDRVREMCRLANLGADRLRVE